MIEATPATTTGSPARPGRWLAAILGSALVLRVALILATPGFTPHDDPADYDRIARSIVSGHGFGPTLLAAPGTPSALRPPGYPLFLALVYELGGHWLAGRLANAVLGTVVVVLIYLIGRLLWGQPAGLLAGALAAVFPPLIALNASLLSEPLFLVLELLVVVCVLAYQRGERPLLWAALAGVLCGASALTRSVGLFLPLAAMVGFLTAGVYSLRLRAASVALLIALTALTIAPWTIRNAVVFHGAFVPVSTQDWITAAGTYNPQAGAPGSLYAVWRPPYFVPSLQHLFGDSINEARLDSVLRSDSVSYASAHPGYVLAATGLNGLRLLLNLGPGHTGAARSEYYEMNVPTRLRPWLSATSDLVIVLALACVLIAWQRRRTQPSSRPWGRLWFMWLVPLFMFASVAPIQGSFRYRAAIDPFFVLAATYALSATARRWSRGRRWRP
jgi:4-amino-4-deoxy-L-arabinose transferase-like glycosyltransferase